MTENIEPLVIQETPQLALMKAKFSGLKQKLSQPFPYFYQLVPKDQIIYNEKLAELASKLKDNPQPIEVNQYLPLIFGKSQGMPGQINFKNQLMKAFNYQNKDFWDEITKQKITSKNYGLPKQKSYSVWEVKDVQQLKDFFDVQQIKKHRKIVKQFSTFYKAINKFVQKFEKLKQQNEISQLYQEYKKAELQQGKLNKLTIGDKNKLNKISKLQMPIIQMKQQIQKEQCKIENIQKQSNKIIENANVIQQEVQKNKQKQEITEKTKQGKQSKKKAQPKQQSSSKKQLKVTVDKQQQMMSQYKSLDLFFKKKKPEIESTQKQQPKMDMEPQVKQSIDKTDILLSLLINTESQKYEFDELKRQFRSHKAIKNVETKTTYVNIVMKRSRLQYYDFPVAETIVNFVDPLQETANVRYDDSSDEYSELVADSINQQMVQQEQEQQQQSQSNSAIVDDSFCEYKSSHVFSSQDSSDEDQIKVKPQINKSVGKWFFNLKSTVQKNQKYMKFEMICLIQEPFPLMTKEQSQESNNQITVNQKIQMYKQIHGSYTAKQVLIKKLNSIVENKISMNKLSTLVKDISEKKGNQRVVKTQIIKQIAEQITQSNPNLEAQLEQIRKEKQIARNQQIQTKKEQKLNERDQKLQKLIIDYEGPMTINAILQHLKNNQMKIIKQQLSSIIKTKQGQFWESIRNQIKKAKLIKGKPKKQKPLKPQKKDDKEELMNSHRPIEQIMKQNEIDMMNKPKKQKKIKHENQMVNEADEEENQQQLHEPLDDQSFELDNKKSKKKNKHKANKSIVKIKPLLPPIRRNSKRNKKKSRYATPQNQEKMEDEQIIEQENKQQSQKQIGQDQIKIKGQNDGQIQQNLAKDQQKFEMCDEGENNKKQEQKQQNKEQIQVTKQEINSQKQQQNNLEQKKSPLKNQDEIAQNQHKNNQKTANKLVQGQQIQINI